METTPELSRKHTSPRAWQKATFSTEEPAGSAANSSEEGSSSNVHLGLSPSATGTALTDTPATISLVSMFAFASARDAHVMAAIPAPPSSSRTFTCTSMADLGYLFTSTTVSKAICTAPVAPLDTSSWLPLLYLLLKGAYLTLQISKPVPLCWSTEPSLGSLGLGPCTAATTLVFPTST
eukprot:CAMPEP_0204288628 /NCGR_PEP_ID=MMETSP0468-20130131/57101_1 /ASSEMBLY_ACC=CAM_ASM_000383 /TAXON_ID=2969 /ORGANISM="Oxyrrhis marina" /LENGTH=178 /DNA_ID=CAMNT_0051266729 /DNA_START=100 /DNA_END=636 /DNA_ORIENTATION=-